VHSSISNSDQVETLATGEMRWLRRYGWAFAVLGIPAGFLVDALLWYAITLDAAYWPEKITGWVNLKGLILGVAISLIPFVWWLGIRLELRWGCRWRKYSIVPVAAVLSVVLLEVMVHQYPAQDIFWQAVRARAGDAFFTREVSLVRLDYASQRASAAKKPGIVVVGSSQMLHALDASLLSKKTGLPVYRRAVAGMFPIELCTWQGFLDAEPGSVLLMMTSAFDLGARDAIYQDALRPLSTARGWRDLVQVARTELLVRNWRKIVDLGFASVCDLWRSRDYARWILQHPMTPPVTHAQVVETDPNADQQREAYTGLGKNEDIVELATSALDVFLRRMSHQFSRIIVVEGRVNPGYQPNRWEELTETAQALLLKLQAEGVLVYVPLHQQNLDLPEARWMDMTHVDAEGRRLYTELFSRLIQSASMQEEIR